MPDSDAVSVADDLGQPVWRRTSAYAWEMWETEVPVSSAYGPVETVLDWMVQLTVAAKVVTARPFVTVRFVSLNMRRVGVSPCGLRCDRASYFQLLTRANGLRLLTCPSPTVLVRKVTVDLLRLMRQPNDRHAAWLWTRSADTARLERYWRLEDELTGRLPPSPGRAGGVKPKRRTL